MNWVGLEEVREFKYSGSNVSISLFYLEGGGEDECLWRCEGHSIFAKDENCTLSVLRGSKSRLYKSMEL